MGIKTVIVDGNLFEQIQYQSSSLPISLYEEYFDDFLNGEVNYHWHDEFELGIVLQGEVEYHINQHHQEHAPRILNAGEGIFVNSKSLHMARQAKPGSMIFDFVFPANFFSLQPSGIVYQNNILPIIQLPLPGLFLSPENDVEREILHVLRQFYELDPRELGYELQCIEIICKIWRHLLIRVSDLNDFPEIYTSVFMQEQRIRLMLSYIHTHYSENIVVDHIAGSANISRSECFRCFKRIIRKSPIEYLCEYRLSRAAQLLTNTGKNVLEICYACGFSSPSYFGKIFKESCGMSPGQFRIQSRNGHHID